MWCPRSQLGLSDCHSCSILRRMLFQKMFLLIPFLLILSGPIQASSPSFERPPAKILRKHLPSQLPTSLSERVRRLLDLHQVQKALISPDGKRLYYNWNVTGTDQIWMLTAPKSFPVQLTSGESKTSLETVSPDGQYIYFTRDENGEDYDGLYRINVKSKEVETIFNKNQVKAQFGGLSADGKRLYFLANDQDPEYFSVYRYLIENKKTELVHFSKAHWTFIGEISENQIYLYQTKGIRDRELYTYNIESQQLELFLGKQHFPQLGYFEAQPVSSNKVLVRSHHESEFYRLYLWDGKDMKPLSPEHKGDVMSFRLDSKRETVFYSIDAIGRTNIRSFHLETLEKIKAPTAKALHKSNPSQVHVESVSQDGRFVTIKAQGPRLPDQLFVWDRESNEVKGWTRLSTPEINLGGFVEPSLEYFPAEDGTLIPMLVRRPTKCKEELCPVVVHYHGGPEAQSRPVFRPLAELFVQSGMIFVEPNVRGSRGLGRQFLEADDGRKRGEVITDVRDCARFIKKNWQKDGIKPPVGITGRSYGGYLTLYAMTRFAGEYDAGAAIVGMSSLVTLLENTAPYRRQRRESEYGSLKEDREFLEELSPINYVNQLSDPLLIMHGVNDKKVPVSEALQFSDKLADHPVKPKLILFPDEGHKIIRRENRVLEYGNLVLFFLKNLKVPSPPVRVLNSKEDNPSNDPESQSSQESI
jgi:dipeptidyl aminopeptidase/acylaminoacyl peptidase